MAINIEQYPRLFAPFYWGPLTAQFEIQEQLPPVELIGNVSIIPFVGNYCVIIEVDNIRWEMPGGTLEPDEDFRETARREMLEEAGALLLDYHPFGAWNVTSAAEQAYRPHLPHPRFYRLVGYGEAELIGAPLNPADAEQVTKVDVVTIDEAGRRFHSSGRDDLADLYALAAFMRAQ